MATSNPTKEGNVKYEVGYKKPPVDKQFGKKNGNPRHNGAWKKESSLRFKWEKILEMDEPELREVLRDPKCGRVEQMTAEVLLDRQMKPTEKIAVLDKLATQIYGQPKQKIEQTVIAPKPLIDLTERAKNGQE